MWSPRVQGGYGEMVMPFIESFFLNWGVPVSRSTKWGHGTVMRTAGLSHRVAAPVCLFSSESNLTQFVPSLPVPCLGSAEELLLITCGS